MAKLLLPLLTAAMLLCHISWTLAKDWNCDNNACDSSSNNNNNNNAIYARQQQQQQQERQQQRLQHDAQQLTTQLRLKLQQQEKSRQQQQEFDPFDFANLRRLQLQQTLKQQQQTRAYYDSESGSGSSSNNNNELPLLLPHNLDNARSYKDNSNSNNNNNGHISSSRSGNKYAINSNNVHNDGDNNDNNNKGNANNSHRRSHMPGHSRNGERYAAAAAGLPQPQDASNDFLLQLSALNEPEPRNTNNNNNNNYDYNDNGNTIADSASQVVHRNNNQNRGVAADADNGGRHAIAVRAESFDNPTVREQANELYDTLVADEEPNNVYADRVLEPNLNTEADNELSAELPYGIQNVRKRWVRGSPALEHHSRSTTYQSLCPTKRVSIPLETAGYEYRPNHYIEVTCAHGFSPSRNYDFNRNKICSEAGFSCIQLNRTIHLIRRNKLAVSDCWESEIRIVPSGCECMWPKHSLGDIVSYHEAQKRYTAEANEVPVADYEPGEGYLQIPRLVSGIGLDGRSTGNGDANLGIGFQSYAFN